MEEERTDEAGATGRSKAIMIAAAIVWFLVGCVLSVIVASWTLFVLMGGQAAHFLMPVPLLMAFSLTPAVLLLGWVPVALKLRQGKPVQKIALIMSLGGVSLAAINMAMGYAFRSPF